MEAANAKYIPLQLETWVDNISHREIGQTRQVLARTVGVSTQLVAGLVGQGFTMSTKSFLLASSANPGRQVQSALRAQDIHVELVRTGRDLGVDGHGRRRRMVVMSKRIDKASRKARAIAHRSQVHRQARILSRTGHRPTIWGVEGRGLAPSTLRRLRAKVAAMSMCHHPGGCSTTAIRLAFSDLADPLVGLRRQLLQEWVRLWRSGLVQRAAVERAWVKIYAGLQAARSRWGKAKRPISAVICTLMDVGWRPWHPSSWEDPDGVVFDVGEGDPDQLSEFDLQGSLNQAAWEQASLHHLGGGVWQGPDLTVLLRHL